MPAGDSKEPEFKEAVLHALDIPRRAEKLDVFKIMFEAGDYFPAGSLLGEEADHLKKISKMILKWEKLSRE
jgi:hypothetical protein